MQRHILAVLAAALLLVGVTSPAYAQQTDLPSMQYAEGSRPTGMAGAYTAVATGPSGLFHNPAGIATARMYAIGATYEYTPFGNVLNASVVDSQTNPKLSAGAAYSYLIGHDNEGVSGHDIRLGLAVPIMPETISVGIGGRYAILKEGDSELARGFTLDAGLLFQIIEQFHAGVTAKNILDICNQPVRCRGVMPFAIAAGVSYGSESTPFRFSGDVGLDINSEADDVNFQYEVGGEYMIAGAVPVRLGYQYRELDTSNHLTAGFGWRKSRFGIDASTNLNLNDLSSFTISSSINLYFN